MKDQSQMANLTGARIHYLKAGTGPKTLVFDSRVRRHVAHVDSALRQLRHLLEAPIPGIGDIWEKVYTTPALWHFHFVNSPIALELVKGRERIFLEHFWQTLSPHPETFSEADRRLYAKSYAQEGAMRAAFEMFKAFNTQDAADNRKFAATKLPMPVLTIEGDKAMGGALEVQAKLVANNVMSILLADTGHWLMEQRPTETKAALKKFFVN